MTSRSQRSAYRILIVEDDADVRHTLVELLKDEEYTVESATNGEEALVSIGRLLPDLVLTDLKMPKMDRAELVRRIADFPTPPEVAVISGSLSEFPEYRGEALGKPIGLDRLLDLVEVKRRAVTRR